MSSKSSRRRISSENARTTRRPFLTLRPSILKFAPVLLMAIAGFATVIWRSAKAHRLADPASAFQVSAGNHPLLEAPANAESATFKTLVNQGSKLLADGKAQEAVDVLSKAQLLAPDDDDVHYNLGMALTRLGRSEEAIEQYQTALRLFPQYVEAHNNLGNLLLRTGRIEEAIKHFEAALAVSPDYASGHNNLGTALQQAGRTNEAIMHFEKASTLNPDYWQAHFNVGTSCLQAGRFDEARRALETVLRLKPDFEPARGALALAQAASK